MQLERSLFKTPCGAAMVSGALAAAVPIVLHDWIASPAIVAVIFLRCVFVLLGPFILSRKLRELGRCLLRAFGLTVLYVLFLLCGMALVAAAWTTTLPLPLIEVLLIVLFISIEILSAGLIGWMTARQYNQPALAQKAALYSIIASLPLLLMSLFCITQGCVHPAQLDFYAMPELREVLVVASILATIGWVATPALLIEKHRSLKARSAHVFSHH
jgi:hypothetical protein